MCRIIKIFKKIKNLYKFNKKSKEESNSPLPNNSIFTKNYFSGFEIGDHSYGIPNVLELDSPAKLYIGKYCSIAQDVTIFLGGEHHTDWVTTYPFTVLWNNAQNYTKGHPTTKGDVVIGNDVWIGRGAVIMSGITINSGAVIAANTIVTKDVPPYHLVGGNPAKIIRARFPKEQVDALLEIKWWDWSEEEIHKALPLMLDNKIQNFIDYGFSKLK